MQVLKPWRLLSSSLVNLGYPGEGVGSDFRKRSVTDLKFISSKKIVVYFFQFYTLLIQTDYP
jgi:hypothetical protein